jgi:hydroxymethylpyrimidine pyrophosphatase-like HAD family hydrolase
LEKIKAAILEKVPGSGVAADQAYREADLAIDYCEDVPPLEMEQVAKIVHYFKQAGAQAKISSIHVNGWFGDYDKRAMTKRLFEEVFETDMERDKQQILFIGDSPNDVPMFKYFPHSVAVANILRFENIIDTKPAWVTKKEGGYGFAEMVEILLPE